MEQLILNAPTHRAVSLGFTILIYLENRRIYYAEGSDPQDFRVSELFDCLKQVLMTLMNGSHTNQEDQLLECLRRARDLLNFDYQSAYQTCQQELEDYLKQACSLSEQGIRYLRQQSAQPTFMVANFQRAWITLSDITLLSELLEDYPWPQTDHRCLSGKDSSAACGRATPCHRCPEKVGADPHLSAQTSLNVLIPHF